MLGCNSYSLSLIVIENNEIIFQFFYCNIAHVVQILLFFLTFHIAMYNDSKIMKTRIFKIEEKDLFGVALTSLTIYFIGALELILLSTYLVCFWGKKELQKPM